MTTAEDIQDWLALEHEAVWLYPVIGARFTALASRARAAYDDHRDVRDELLSRLHRMGVTPVSTALSYDVGRLRTKASALAAARQVESGIAGACLALAGDSIGELRTYATAGLRRAALAEMSWDGRPEAFPGIS